MEGVPEKAIHVFWSVRVYNKNVSSQCNLLAQIEQEIVFILQYNVNQDKTVRKKHEKKPQHYIR